MMKQLGWLPSRELTYPTWGPTEINTKLVVVTCHDFFRSWFTFGAPNFQTHHPRDDMSLKPKAIFHPHRLGALAAFGLKLVVVGENFEDSV